MPKLTLPDTELDYAVAGRPSGIPVLLIQGVGAAGSAWTPQVKALAGRFCMATYDNRGLCGSVPCRGPVSIEVMAEDGLALMDALGWESAHVAGHSMGGVIAQQLALSRPARVRSLSLLCTFSRGRDAARLTPWVLWMSLRTRLGTRPMRRNAFLEMLLPGSELRNGDRAGYAARFGELLGRDLADSPPVLMKQVRALARHDASGRLGELAGIPTLVLSGDRDPIARTEYGRDLARRIPGAVFEVFTDTSHGLPIQRDWATNERLRSFWEAVEARR